MSKKLSIHPKTLIDRAKTAQLSSLFFSRWPGTATAHTPKFVGVQHKKHLRDINVTQTCVSSEKKLIVTRIGLFGDYEGRDFTICLKYRAQLGMRFRPSGL